MERKTVVLQDIRLFFLSKNEVWVCHYHEFEVNPVGLRFAVLMNLCANSSESFFKLYDLGTIASRAKRWLLYNLPFLLGKDGHRVVIVSVFGKLWYRERILKADKLYRERLWSIIKINFSSNC